MLTIIFRVLCFIMEYLPNRELDDSSESFLSSINKIEYNKFLSNHQAYIELEDYLLDTYGDLYTCPLCSKKLLTPHKYCFSCFARQKAADRFDLLLHEHNNCSIIRKQSDYFATAICSSTYALRSSLSSSQ